MGFSSKETAASRGRKKRDLRKGRFFLCRYFLSGRQINAFKLSEDHGCVSSLLHYRAQLGDGVATEGNKRPTSEMTKKDAQLRV